MMINLRRNRCAKRYCARCHAQCTDIIEYVTCDGCTRFFHQKCLFKSKKYVGKKFNESNIFFCSMKCEATVFPFNLVRDKEFVKMNAQEIKEPCTKCGGECHRFDIIQCDECDKWTHRVCTSLSKEEFNDLGNSSKPFICSKKCEMKVFPFFNLGKNKFSERSEPEYTNGEVAIMQAQNVLKDVAEDEPNPNCNYLDCDEIHELGLIHGTKDLTIFHGNVGSLPKNQNKIEELFRDAQKLPDIICTTETKLLKGKDVPSKVGIKGYEFEHCPTPTDKGGAGIFVADYLDFDIRNDLYLNMERIEDIWIQLKQNKDKKDNPDCEQLVIGVIYRHPGSQYKEFENRLCDTISLLNRNQTKFVIVGDVNINYMKMNVVTDITNYFNNLQGAGCLSFINRATRVVQRGKRWQTSCPDHVYSNLHSEKVESNIITSNISDHFSTIVTIKGVKNKHIPKTDVYVRKKVLSQVEWNNFNNELQKSLNEINFLDENVHEITNQIIEIYQKLVDKYMPLRKLTRKEKSFFYKPWLTKGIQTSMKTRDFLHKQSIKLKTESAEKEYKKFKKFVIRIQAKSFNSFHSNKITKNFRNKKKLWESIGEVTKHKKRKNLIIKRLTNNGNEIRGTQEIANCLNNHFNSIGNTMAAKIHNPSAHNDQSLTHIPFVQDSVKFNNSTLEELKKLIRELKVNKAPGSDGINSFIIKKTEKLIAPVLVKLFNKCMDNGIFPDSLKIASIIPLHKGGVKNEATNYRPISLLPLFSKIFEKVIKHRLITFLDKNNLITDNQFGFRKSHSTELAVIDIQNTLLKNLDNNKLTCTIFLDLAKAFDSVNHNILLKKLERYGIRGMPLKLMKSYLSNRQHLTKLDGITSSLKLLEIGVPQGSVLGPLLFLLFINDLPLVTDFNVKLFADDTFLSLEGNDLTLLQRKANAELRKVSKWFSENKLTLNVSKSKYMIIRRGYRKSDNIFSLKFNGKKMEQCSTYKYLGLHIDEKLNWKNHVKYLCEKLSKMCGIFAKLRHCCNKALLRTIYFALVESHLQYCNIIWGSASEKTLAPLVKLQDKIIRIICFAQPETRIEDLYNDLKLLDLTQLNKLTKAKFVYKFKNKKLPRRFDNFLKTTAGQHKYALRSVETQEYKCVWGKSNFGMKMLQYEGVQLWNAIPDDIRNANSLREFSKKFKSIFFD